MKTIERVSIVEYEETFAAGVAKMWNESRDSWGGDAVVTTEQDVRDKESKSTNLNLFLAIVEDEVVGYCGLSEYKEDTGALYIPLLNVHPDYHGLKIGKQLLLRAIEKTVEYGWPRLDLFTWPGNTKAVPLYKKCGFFWEERDDATHLMNFMPLVLQIDALRPFFEKHDWYATSERPVEVKPDGIKSGDYTFYEYHWEVGDEFVRIQVERTGRGIRLVETQDWRVELVVPDFKLLEKEQHHASYQVVNQKEAPLKVSLNGRASDIVDQPLNMTSEVMGEWSLEVPFKVEAPDREPGPWKTHSVIGGDVTVNGSVLPLRVGVFPIKAGKVDARSIKPQWRPRQKGKLFLDLESRLQEKSTWTIQLPQQKVVEWEETSHIVSIKGKERLSLPVPVCLLKNGFLNEEIEVGVETESGRAFSFKTTLSLAFSGFGGKFGGESETHWYGYNGPYFVKIEKRNHVVEVGSTRSKEEPLIFLTPKLGEPYNEEFSKKEASTVEYIELAEAFVIKTTLESEAFQGIMLNSYYKIYGDGLVETHHEIVNSGTETHKQLYLLQPVFPKFKSVAIPEKDGVMVGTEALIPFAEYFRDQDISERWMFTSNREGETFGIAWPEEAIGRKDDWRFAFEYHVDELKPEQKLCLGPIQIGVHTARDWREWRELVFGEDMEAMEEKPIFDLEAIGGFISKAGKEVNHSFRSLLTPHLHGTLTIKMAEGTFVKKAKPEDGVTAVNLPLVHEAPGVKEMLVKFNSSGRVADFRAYHLVAGKKKVRVTNEENHVTVDNGVFTFSASESYFPGVYSLIFNGRELLHHQYPEAGPRSWWNPWGGGLRFAPDGVSPHSMVKEKTEIKRATKVDQDNNSWTGICLTTTFLEHEKMKGVTLNQFVLTLPEVPVVALFAEIEQGAPRTFIKENLGFEAFFKPGETLSSCYARIPTEGVFDTYYAGVEEYDLEASSSIVIGSDEFEESLTFIHPSKKQRGGLYVNQDVFFVESAQEWSASQGDTVAVKPTVLLISENDRPFKHHPFHSLSFEGK